MTNDKHGKAIHVGEQVHFEIDGRPYSGIVHSLVRRDHEPAIMTIVQLYLPATQVSKEAPSKQKPSDKTPTDTDDPENSTGYVHPAVIQRLNEREDAKKGRADLNEEKQHSNQQEPKPAEANRGTTKAEPPTNSEGSIHSAIKRLNEREDIEKTHQTTPKKGTH